jgi:hypothetical protein
MPLPVVRDLGFSLGVRRTLRFFRYINKNFFVLLAIQSGARIYWISETRARGAPGACCFAFEATPILHFDALCIFVALPISGAESTQRVL